MKILRDETGQVFLGLATNTQTVKPSTDPQPGADITAPAAVASTSTARPTQHCSFYCRYCDAVLFLPHDQLGLAFAAPVLRRTSLRAIGAVCGSCHHVAVFSLFRGIPGFDTRHKLAAVPRVGNTVLVDMLHCGEESCDHPLPLFVTSEDRLTGDAIKEQGQAWDWDQLTCASGHRIRRPVWLYDRNPLIFPQPLK